MVALEGQLPTMYQKYIEHCRALGFSEDSLRFFTVHIEGDAEHADVGFREDLAVGACRASAQMRVQYLDAVSRAIKEMT